VSKFSAPPEEAWHCHRHGKQRVDLFAMRTSISRRLRRQRNREDVLPPCIVVWPLHYWQTGRDGILNYQNADWVFVAPQLWSRPTKLVKLRSDMRYEVFRSKWNILGITSIIGNPEELKNDQIEV
jgi:hypothetical protein